ncbi:MAG TPA: hypothetical protein PK965_05185 [Anaerohalosphaeraceae bacterium]|nr:hypothetical protein [Anaerohalosphaeraceae bacterium]
MDFERRELQQKGRRSPRKAPGRNQKTLCLVFASADTSFFLLTDLATGLYEFCIGSAKDRLCLDKKPAAE